MPGGSIKIEVGGITKSHTLDKVGGQGIEYIPTDEELEKIASMINSGIVRTDVLLTDKTTGKVHDVYVSNGKLMMDNAESEG